MEYNRGRNRSSKEDNMSDILDVIRNNLHLSDSEIGKLFDPPKTKRSILGYRHRNNIHRGDEKTLQQQVADDGKILRLSKEKRVTNAKYKQLLEEKELLESKLEAVRAFHKNPTNFKIGGQRSQKHGEATIIALASDWHIEERVTREQTSGLAEHNLAVSQARSKEYFEVLARLVKIERHETKVENLVLALLGDFISGDIHDDTSKSAEIEPMHAIVRWRDYVFAGIKYLLQDPELKKITVMCHSGNHGRKDKQQMIANEAGNSIEYLAYHFLANDFANDPRVQFIIPEGYHSYLNVYDTTIRFHHGHAIRYGGGVGGITIPVNKAIAQWNKGKHADIDCFGHFHQAFDGNNFVVNGSQIGYSAYGLFVKGEYQKPMQMTFGVHSRMGKYVTRPIFYSI